MSSSFILRKMKYDHVIWDFNGTVLDDMQVGIDSVNEMLAAAWRAAHPSAVAVVIGDTVHDFAVAQAMGADCILVAAGHHSYEKLTSCGVPVVDDLFACADLLLS